MTPEEHPHHFHSPLNSNCVVTLNRNDENDPASELSVVLAHIERSFDKYHVLEVSESLIRVKFIDKEDAERLELWVQQQQQHNDDGHNDEHAHLWAIHLDYDALTHPGNIYVRGLTPEINTQDLHQLFGPFGEIASCKIVTDEFGRSRGYGFVNFTNGDAADEAIGKLNGLLVNGSKLYLNHHIAKKERLERIDFEKSHFTTLYVKNFADSFGEEDLKQLFSQYGEVTSILLPESREKSPAQMENASSSSSSVDGAGSSFKRFGFVGFKTHQAAQRALEELDGKQIEADDDTTQCLYVSRAQRREDRRHSLPQPLVSAPLPPHVTAAQQPFARPPTSPITNMPLNTHMIGIPPHIPPASAIQQMPTFFPLPGPDQQQSNLYVKNLTPAIDDDALYNAFAPYGIIVSAKIMTNEIGAPRGFGFVCFKTIAEASRALVSMNGVNLDGQMIHVSFAQRNNRRSKSSAGTETGYKNGFNNNYQYFYPGMMPTPQYNNYVPQQYGNGNGHSNGNGNRYKKNQSQSQSQSQNYQPAQPQLSEHDHKMVQLSAQMASTSTDDEKRETFLNELILPKLREQGQDESQGDFIMDKLLKQYDTKTKENRDDVWLDMINDWANEDTMVGRLQKLAI